MNRAIFALGLLLTGSPSIAGEVGTLYIKNNADARMDIWVDGIYQGYVLAGKTAYVVSAGFMTADGRQESHGGWRSKEKIKVKCVVMVGEASCATSEADVDGDRQQIGRVWAGRKDAGPQITDADVQNAVQIGNGAKQDPGRRRPVDELRAKASPVSLFAGRSYTIPDGRHMKINKNGTCLLYTDDANRPEVAGTWTWKDQGKVAIVNWGGGPAEYVVQDNGNVKFVDFKGVEETLIPDGE